MEPGQWVVAMGHPGGYQEKRPPVVRLGRVLATVAGDAEGVVGDHDGQHADQRGFGRAGV